MLRSRPSRGRARRPRDVEAWRNVVRELEATHRREIAGAQDVKIRAMLGLAIHEQITQPSPSLDAPGAGTKSGSPRAAEVARRLGALVIEVQDAMKERVRLARARGDRLEVPVRAADVP